MLTIAPSNTRLSVAADGVFASEQGEGPTAGESAVFLRLQGCNLSCTFCDSRHTWDIRDPDFRKSQVWSIEETLQRITDAAGDTCRRLVITGGEPMLQERIAELCARKPLTGWDLEIETNGTIEPTAFHSWNNVQINCSPKGSNSGMPKERRINPGVLHRLRTDYETYFKFVAGTVEDVREFERDFLEGPLRGFDRSRVYFSPEGDSKEQIDAVRAAIAEEVERVGCILGDRLQIRAYGNVRGT